MDHEDYVKLIRDGDDSYVTQKDVKQAMKILKPWQDIDCRHVDAPEHLTEEQSKAAYDLYRKLILLLIDIARSKYEDSNAKISRSDLQQDLWFLFLASLHSYDPSRARITTWMHLDFRGRVLRHLDQRSKHREIRTRDLLREKKGEDEETDRVEIRKASKSANVQAFLSPIHQYLKEEYPDLYRAVFDS